MKKKGEPQPIVFPNTPRKPVTSQPTVLVKYTVHDDCPHCRHIVGEKDRFCGYCGKTLPGHVRRA